MTLLGRKNLYNSHFDCKNGKVCDDVHYPLSMGERSIETHQSTNYKEGATHVAMLPVNAKETSISAKRSTHVDMPPILSKAGFTLAEVLITLGIIGVVAAMTIPNLMSKIQWIVLKQQYKEAYSTLNQALRLVYEKTDTIYACHFF